MQDHASQKNRDHLIGMIQSQCALASLRFTEFLPLWKVISFLADMKFVSALMLLKFHMTSDKFLRDLLPSGKKKIYT